jgi:endonuclease/exonuclease/phosphatase family metal-dependent hydrolase
MTKKGRHILRRALLYIGIVVNLIVLMAILLAAYAGYVNPDDMAFFGIIGMTFGLCVAADIFLLIIDLIFKWQLAIIPIVGLLGSIGPLLSFSPLHFGKHLLTDDEQSRAFSVLSYNVMQFQDFEDIYSETGNRTVQYIIEANADMVCMQECLSLSVNDDYHITQAQIDSLHIMYPYWLAGTAKADQTILSKYPIKSVAIAHVQGDDRDITAYQLTIDGRPLTVFNVHMQSIGLNTDDKELYINITDGSLYGDDIGRVRSQLWSKLYAASRQRADQARRLSGFVNNLDENGSVIICGDFNDVPGCYAINQLKSAGMRDVYAEVGCGPTITYIDNRFYFRIDHMMYKGSLYPKNIRRGSIRSSDHYPLLATFVWMADERIINE